MNAMVKLLLSYPPLLKKNPLALVEEGHWYWFFPTGTRNWYLRLRSSAPGKITGAKGCIFVKKWLAGI